MEVNLEAKLKEFFGYNEFRAYQKEIIQAVLEQRDVMAILPTGAGKSICYQLPSLLSPGTAIVVSPLISLMQDQVVSLFKNGIAAAFINSSLHYQDLADVLNQLADYKLVYVAPERLTDPSFIQRLKEISLSFFVIDEAHCISQWGHAFRGEYRKLSILKETFPDKPIMALTATATPEVERDIMSQLLMDRPKIVKGSFDRPNLTIKISPKIKVDAQIVDYLLPRQAKSGIIYAATRKTVDAIFSELQQRGFQVGRYHAGMSDQERASSQHDFLHDKVRLMVATVAFGMGIHKPDIRFILHVDMPKTIEQYYQEIGRAGRDGLESECLMLYGTQNLVLYKTFLDQIEDPAIRQEMKRKTDKMYRLCTSLACRRQELLSYFGEKTQATTCRACDNCLDEDDLIDGTVIAQKILSCVFRLNQNFGVRTVVDVLRGSKNQAVVGHGFDRLSTYGLLKDLSEKELRYYIDSLIQQEFLSVTSGEYPVLKWAEKAQQAVQGKQQIQFKNKAFKDVAIKQQKKPIPKEESRLQYDEILFAQLSQFRQELAKQENSPPFVVFSDRSLQEMAVYFPHTQEEFSKINGVGPIKWIKYGQKFLDKIKAYRHANPAPLVERPLSPMQRKQSSEETIRLYQMSLSIEEIMAARQLAKSTILTHLVEGIQQGVELNIRSLVSPEKQVAIQTVIETVGTERLAPIKEKLSSDFSYDEIRLVLAFYHR